MMAFVGKLYKCDRCGESFTKSHPHMIKTNFYRFDLLCGRDWSGGGEIICPDCAKSFRQWMGGREQIPFRRLGDTNE